MSLTIATIHRLGHPNGEVTQLSRVICIAIAGANANCYSITRLVKNGSVISVTDGSFSSEVTTVINSFLQFQQCQRS